LGVTDSPSGYGIYGIGPVNGMKSVANNTTGVTTAFIGTVNSKSGIAAIFNNNAGGPLASFRNNGVQEIGFDASGDVTAAGVVTGSQLVSTVGTGTPPLTVTSTTVVPNLNAGYLGGVAASGYPTLAGANTFTANQTLSITSVPVVLGDMGCGGATGISFASPSSCTNYALVGDGSNTFLNRSSGNYIAFREGNSPGGDQMQLLSGGGLWIAAPTTSAVGLEVKGGGVLIDPPATDSGHSGLQVTGASANSTSEAAAGINSTGGYGNDDGPHGGQGGIFTGGASLYGNGGDGVDIAGGTAQYGGSGGVGISVTGGLNWDGSTYNYAGYFGGNIEVTGAITAGTKDFKIDHPLDPANKYLYHASVESSEMMNIYDGMATLDSKGEAVVQLPDWFEAVNSDFRYVLTAVGAPGPNLYIAEKIANGQFKIAGGSPGKEVSWMVTGVRQDAFAKAHPLQVEVEKTANVRGYYIHPELYGASEDKQERFAGHPERLRRAQEARKKAQEAAAKKH
jgi:hypothetical protein